MAVLHRNCACLLNFKKVIRSIQNHLLNLMNVNPTNKKKKINQTCHLLSPFKSSNKISSFLYVNSPIYPVYAAEYSSGHFLSM